mmetsp:Transcript_26320/g.44924  ORF Transcript_26320/g.44924 Transcript_26320/m.44924 type:complete len:136 (-) Transcript_26320:981-1388(-)|eukprot:CAMPEP_0183729312 /NCGR_PEP_ID=MMETSP0737-20130205/30017_1 /TAXON_ID=385413 /ORGANISM="Thalassiosira miniscula, Strain CCMP1093" /LENGTH=135 /DNA_ID=CAMNT_0025961463 /DNA_START=251 /DNA_END=658 /DNA_ORIENTATION=+
MRHNNQTPSQPQPQPQPTIFKLFQCIFNRQNSGGTILLYAVVTSFILSNCLWGSAVKQRLSNIEKQGRLRSRLFEVKSFLSPSSSSFERYTNTGGNYFVAVNGPLASTWSPPKNKDGVAYLRSSSASASVDQRNT